MSAGTLQIGGGAGTGSLAGNIKNDATLAFNRSGSLTYGGVISGTGTLVNQGPGTVSLTGANTFTGDTLLQAGTLSLGSADALGTGGEISFTGGALQFTSANNSDLSARFSIADSQAYKLDTNGQSVILGTNLTSSGGSLEKLGTGTLSLSGNNTFAGGTTLTAGTLSLGSTGALGPTDLTDPAAGPISFAGGTLQYTASNTLDYSARFSPSAGQTYSIDTNGQSVEFASNLTSPGASLAKLGAGTLALTGANDVSGGLSLQGGTLELGSAGAIGGSGPIEFRGGTLQFTAANTDDVSGRLSAATGQAFRVDTNGQTVAFDTAIDGARQRYAHPLGRQHLQRRDDRLGRHAANRCWRRYRICGRRHRHECRTRLRPLRLAHHCRHHLRHWLAREAGRWNGDAHRQQQLHRRHADQRRNACRRECQCPRQ